MAERRGPSRRGRDARAALLRHAAERAAEHQFFVASVLLPWARAEGLDDAALAARLGCSVEVLPRLLLCRRPDPEPAAFQADVTRIAEGLGIPLVPLVETLRLAETLAALREQADAAGGLAAARDRESEPEAP